MVDKPQGPQADGPADPGDEPNETPTEDDPSADVDEAVEAPAGAVPLPDDAPAKSPLPATPPSDDPNADLYGPDGDDADPPVDAAPPQPPQSTTNTTQSMETNTRTEAEALGLPGARSSVAVVRECWENNRVGPNGERPLDRNGKRKPRAGLSVYAFAHAHGYTVNQIYKIIGRQDMVKKSKDDDGNETEVEWED